MRPRERSVRVGRLLDGSDDHLWTGTVPTGVPLAMCCFFKTHDSASQALISLGNNGTFGFQRLVINGPVANLAAHQQQPVNGVTSYAAVGAAHSLNAWHHAAATFTASNRRSIYLDGSGT